MTSKNTVIYTSGVPPPRCACLQAPGSTILMFSGARGLRKGGYPWSAPAVVCHADDEDRGSRVCTARGGLAISATWHGPECGVEGFLRNSSTFSGDSSWSYFFLMSYVYRIAPNKMAIVLLKRS